MNKKVVEWDAVVVISGDSEMIVRGRKMVRCSFPPLSYYYERRHLDMNEIAFSAMR